MQRANIKRAVRALLHEHNLIEVDVPALCPTVCPDVAVEPISLDVHHKKYYLQPSPEFCLKKVLSKLPVDMYSLAAAYRADRSSPLHQYEFLMLEMYLIGADKYHALQDLSVKVMQCCLGDFTVRRRRYVDLWKDIFHVEYSGNKSDLMDLLNRYEIDYNSDWSAYALEDLLFGLICQPQLGLHGICDIIDGFPIQHAALAKIDNQAGYALRFEIFWHGVEIANGYDELTDKMQNQLRMENWMAQRRLNNQQPCEPLDENFLEALDSFPDSSGVAIGFERLMMFGLQKKSLKESMVFYWES